MQAHTSSYSASTVSEAPPTPSGKLKEILTTLTGLVMLAFFLLVSAFLFGLLVDGGAWLSSILLPWFAVGTWVVLGLAVFVFLPLAICRATRRWGSLALSISSFVFGATLFMEALLLTLSLWGIIGVSIGLLFLGVGLIPVAMLATLVHGMLAHLLELVLLAILTIASARGAVALAQSLEAR